MTADIGMVSTSFVKRHNLTMQMSMRRYTRPTNAFSERLQGHIHMCALFFVLFNFVRVHRTLRTTPAMAGGLTKTLYDSTRGV